LSAWVALGFSLVVPSLPGPVPVPFGVSFDAVSAMVLFLTGSLSMNVDSRCSISTTKAALAGSVMRDKRFAARARSR
jgi:hypothetical protein